MPTPRRKTSGFNAEPEAKEELSTETASNEEKEIQEFLDVAATEMFETISREEEKAVEEKPFIAPEITPTPDAGPRFLPKEEQPAAKAPQAPPQPVAPRRHPRNVPKFSRTK
jgi:hypothetical protein